MKIRLIKPTCLVLLAALTAYGVSVFIGVNEFYTDPDMRYEKIATDTPGGRVYVLRGKATGITSLKVERPARPQVFEKPSDEFFPVGFTTTTTGPDISSGYDEEAWKTNYYAQFEVLRWSSPWWMPSEQDTASNREFQVRAIGYPFAMLRHVEIPDEDGWYDEYRLVGQLKPGFTRPIQQRPELQTDFRTLHFFESSRSGCTIFINAATVPLIPMPLGLVANTVFYAGSWWLFLTVPLKAKRSLQARHRTRIGCCPRCKYDLVGLSPDEPCPECGRINALRSEASCEPSPAAS